MTKPTMTLRALGNALLNLQLELELGAASFRRSSAYHDYVAVEIACFVNDLVVRKIEKQMRALCDAHGWTECRVAGDEKRNGVSIIMHQANIIATTNKRMPAA